MAEGAYKGPRQNRRMLDDKTVFVSKEELADFKKRFGADKTLKDLLNADKTGKLPEPVSRRSESASKKETADIPKGSEKAPARTGELAKGPSNLEKVLMGLPVAGGMYAGYRMAKGAKAGQEALRAAAKTRETSPMLRRSGEGMEAATRAAKASEAREPSLSVSRMPRMGEELAPKVTTDTGRRFTPKQEMEAAEASIRGAAARKEMADKRAGRSKAMEEAKTQRMMRDEKKKPSPRARTRDEENIEFSRGGMAKKRK